jgi:hypothetical protein
MGISSATRGSSHGKVIDRQHAIASGVLARTISNRDWVKAYNCRSAPATGCQLTNYIKPTDPLLREPEGIVSHQVTIVAIGADLANDGVAPNDADRQVPDVYRISVTVKTVAPPTVGTFKDYTVVGTLDMSVRSTTGVLRLRSCSVTSQVDERIGVGLCSSNATQSLPIAAPGSGAAYCPAATPIASASSECAAWRQSAASSVPGVSAITLMKVAPLGMSFTLTGPMNEDPPPAVTITTDSTGNAEVTDLKPGRYALEANAGNVWSLWNSHSVPSGGEITIKAGEVNDALQVFRPAAGNVTNTLKTLNTTDPYNEVESDGAWVRRAVKLVPVPAGRSALANGADRGWTKINRGDTSVVINDVSPGLYQLDLLEFPGNHSIPLYQPLTPTLRYVWIAPKVGTTAEMTQVPATLTLRDEYCDIAGRQALMAARIVPWQTSLGMLNTGFIWIGPDSREYWHGPCTNDNPNHEQNQNTGTAGA